MKTDTFENGVVKSVTCHRFQSKSERLSKIADGLKHAQSQVPVVSSFSSALVWIGENDNASVDENILLRFRRDENRPFRKRISAYLIKQVYRFSD